MLQINVLRLVIIKEFETPLKAFADISINDAIVVKGLKLFKTDKRGFYVSMPAIRNEKDGRFYDIVQALTQQASNSINLAVIEAYTGGTTTQENNERKEDFAINY